MSDAATLASPPPSGTEPAADLVFGSFDEPAVGVRLVVATEDREVVEPLVPRLAERGLDARVLPLVPGDERPLIVGMLGASEPTIFVLCVTPTIAPEAIRALVSAFSTHRERIHRLVVVEIEKDRPTSALTAISRSAQVMQQQRDMVYIAPGGRDRERIGVGGVHLVSANDAQRRAAPGPAEVIVEHPLTDRVGPIPRHIRLPLQDRARPRLRVVVPLDDDDSPAAASPEGSPPPSEPAVPQSVECEMLHCPPTERLSIDPGWGRGSMRVGAGIFGVVSLVAVAVMALDEQPSGSRAPTIPSEVGASMHEIADVVRASVPRRPAALRARDTEAAPAVGPLPPTPPVENELTRAVERGEVFAFGDSHYAPPDLREVTWKAAATRCKVMRVAGTRGWRLPRSDELDELHQRGWLSEGSFWSINLVMSSETPANWVYDTQAGRLVGRDKVELAGVVCTRRDE